jgi:hypothetical protein
LGQQSIDSTDLIKTWRKMDGETPPTTASSVPATAPLFPRPDSLFAPKGKPEAMDPRPATQRPAPMIPEGGHPRKGTRSPVGFLEQIQQAGNFVRQTDAIIKRMRQSPPERCLPDPLNVNAKVTDEDLESAMATAKTNYGIPPGSYVPGSPTSLEPEQSPENQAAEVAEITGWIQRIMAAEVASSTSCGSQN